MESFPWMGSVAQIDVDDFGIGLHLLHRSFGEDLSLVHDGDLVGDALDEIHVVLDHDHRAALADALQQVQRNEQVIEVFLGR